MRITSEAIPRPMVVLANLIISARLVCAQNWEQTGAPSTNWTCVASSANGARLVATATGDFPGNAGLIYISTNSGATWAATSAPVTNWASVCSSADGAKLAAAGGGGLFTSTDFG